MSVDRGWIAGQEGNTSIIGDGVNSQGDTVGSVSRANYLFNDGTLDYFEADVPEYFTTFGIGPLDGRGNLGQLITLSISQPCRTSIPEPGSPHQRIGQRSRNDTCGRC